MRVLAATLMRDRRRGEAIDLMQQVVEIGQRVSGSDAKETIADVKELARYQTEPIFPPMRLGSFEIFRADLLDPRGPALPLSSR